MTITESIASVPVEGKQPLDPFGLSPELASRIANLWRHGTIEHDAYAFHTPYVGLTSGRNVFSLRFDCLQAATGVLVISINQLAAEPGHVADTVKTVMLPLSDLAFRNGHIDLEIRAQPERCYAILGRIEGATDAVADGLSIAVTYSEEAPARSASGDGGSALAVGRLISCDPPTLAAPVSQVFTRAQLDEASYDRWLSFLGVSNARDRKQWETIFILQASKCYGALQPGARALSIGADRVLPGALADLGCEVRVAQWSEDRRDLMASDTAAKASARKWTSRAQRCDTIDVQIVPHDSFVHQFTDLDLVVGTGIASQMSSGPSALELAEIALLSLRRGGLAVFTTDFQRDIAAAAPEADPPLLRRTEIERFILLMLARGHDVAQLRYASLVHGAPVRRNAVSGEGGDREITSLGLIVRRG